MDLIVYLQRIMKNILVNLADYYPQAPITGGTLKMKEVINEVNRVYINNSIFPLLLPGCDNTFELFDVLLILVIVHSTLVFF